MTPEQLKASILQLAIQGKLVEQSPEEGTSEDLYQQIQEKKTNLIKEGKLKKEKPLAPIEDDEIPFDIPDSWRWVRIGDLYKHNTGKALNSSNIEGKKLPYITTSNLYWNRFELNNLKKMFFKESEIEKCSVQKGDLLVCEGGDIGRAAIWNFDYQVCIQNHIHKLRGYIQLSTLFYYYIFLYYKLNNSISGRGIGIQGLSSNALHNLVVPLPPLAEQKRIVDKVEELLPLVEKYKKAYSELEILNSKFSGDMKKSILQYAIQGKLVEQRPEEGTAEDLYQQIQEEKQNLIKEGKLKKEKPLAPIEDDEIPFDIPEDWKWVRLRSIVFNHGQKTPNQNFMYIEINSIDNTTQKLTNDINIVTPEKAPSRARKIVCEGDILYATVRPYLHNMCIVEGEFQYEPIASTGFAVMTCIKGVLNKYLFYSLLSPFFDKYANDSENSKGISYPAINDEKLYKALIPLPPLAEQKRIVAKVEELLALCDKLKLK